MFKARRNIFVAFLLVMTIFLVGCGGDDGTTTLIEGVDGPMTVIVGEDSKEFEVDVEFFDSEGNVDWVASNDKVSFNSPNEESTTVRGEEVGMTKISVKVGGTHSDWFDFEVLGQDNYRHFRGNEESGFHAIVPTRDGESSGVRDRTGYLAAGYNMENGSRRLYFAKADTRGLTQWDNQLGVDGRFYGIQSIVYSTGGDKYYLLGYQRETGNSYRPYIAKIDNQGNMEESYLDRIDLSGNAFLRDGIGIQSGSTANEVEKMVAVGNHVMNSSRIVPLIVTVDVESGEIDTKPLVYSSLDEDYYNLQSIVKVDGGYLAVGFAGGDSDSSSGIILRLDEEFNLDYKRKVDQRLWKIKGKDNDGLTRERSEFVVVGDDGYVAKVNLDDNDYDIDIVGGRTIEEVAVLRDLLTVDDGYILVGTENTNNSANGLAIKVDEDLNNAGSFGEGGIAKFGTYIHSVAESTDDGHYLLAGTSRKDGIKAYVVKIDDWGRVVERNLVN